MPRATYLSEEDEAAELATQTRLREVDDRLRSLRVRLDRTIADADRTNDELELLRGKWAAKEHEVVEARNGFRELGRRLDELRDERGKARARIVEIRSTLLALPAERPEAARVRVERIRRQLLDLQVRQQTVALSLTEENAIIDRIREIRKTLVSVEAELHAEEKERAHRGTVETELRDAQIAADRLGIEAVRQQAARRAQYEQIQARRAGATELLGQLRQKAQARDLLDTSVRTLLGQLDECEAEIGRMLRESRERRREARDTLHEFGRRPKLRGAAPPDQVEQQLSDLLRNGKIRLGG